MVMITQPGGTAYESYYHTESTVVLQKSITYVVS